MRSGRGNGEKSGLRLLFAALLLVWLGGWLWWSRHHMLDDALIHLRFAENLRLLSGLYYNSSQPSFGSSSLLYVTLLAPLTSFGEWPPLAKAVSVVAYVSLVSSMLWRAQRGGGAANLWWWLALCCSGPLAIRWLSDGMETSLALVVLLFLVAVGYQVQQSFDGLKLGVFTALSVLAVFLRVELAAVVIALGVASLWQSSMSPAQRTSVMIAVVFSVALPVSVTYLALHQVLPDTAVAKATGTMNLALGKSTLGSLLAGGVSGAVCCCCGW